MATSCVLGRPKRRSALSHLVKGWVLIALVACTDPIGPEDPRHEEFCTIYVGVGEPAEITRWMIEHCETVSVWVVKFDGSMERFEVRPRELLGGVPDA